MTCPKGHTSFLSFDIQRFNECLASGDRSCFIMKADLHYQLSKINLNVFLAHF